MADICPIMGTSSVHIFIKNLHTNRASCTAQMPLPFHDIIYHVHPHDEISEECV